MSGFVSAGGKRLTTRRVVVTLALSTAACAAVALLAPLVGHSFELLGADAFHAGTAAHEILLLRLEEVGEALLVGGALSAAGCALQALLRNPLAEPFTLGISSGASLAAVLAIRLGAERAFGGLGTSGAALLGAAGTLVLVARLGRIGRQLPPATLVLAGVTISMFCSSASVLVQYTSDFAEVSHMLAWMMGSLDPARFPIAVYMAPAIGVGLAVLIIYAPELNALAAGAEVAASLGVAVERTQRIVFAVSSLLVGAAIAIAGPIGFIGLVVPHALRAIIGPDHRLLVPASILVGAALLGVCDTFTRTALAWARLPTGAVTAVLGVPLFIAILMGARQRASLWGRG
jgi:iron complex transport system permease protein